MKKETPKDSTKELKAQIAELQAQVKTLTDERDKYSHELDKTEVEYYRIHSILKESFRQMSWLYQNCGFFTRYRYNKKFVKPVQEQMAKEKEQKEE